MTRIPVESSDIVGSPVGALLVSISMVGDALEACSLEAGLAGFGDAGPSFLVLVVGGHLADAGAETDRIPVLADGAE